MKLGVRRSFTALLMKLVCVCLFVRPCLCAFFVCLLVRLYVFVYQPGCSFMFVFHWVTLFVCVCVYLCACACVYVCIYMYVSLYVCAYMRMRACVSIRSLRLLKRTVETMRARIVHTHTQITRHCIIIKAHTP